MALRMANFTLHEYAEQESIGIHVKREYNISRMVYPK